MDAPIRLGVVARAHGIRGELLLDWDADTLDALDGPLFLRSGGRPPRPIRILSWRPHGGRPLIRLEGVTDRNAAELLRGAEILASRADLPEPDEDERYVADLLGCDVLLPDGTRLGRLDHLEAPGGGNLLWSVVADGGAEILIPADPRFIVSLEPEASRIVVDPPEGLVELYLGGESGAGEA